MLKRLVFVGILCALALPAYAEQTPEMFIPIGERGPTGEFSMVGGIKEFNNRTQILTFVREDGMHTVQITAYTKIWLDMSANNGTNQVGSTADCQKGRLLEVKFVSSGATRTDVAEWVKIRVKSESLARR